MRCWLGSWMEGRIWGRIRSGMRSWPWGGLWCWSCCWLRSWLWCWLPCWPWSWKWSPCRKRLANCAVIINVLHNVIVAASRARRSKACVPQHCHLFGPSVSSCVRTSRVQNIFSPAYFLVRKKVLTIYQNFDCTIVTCIIVGDKIDQDSYPLSSKGAQNVTTGCGCG